MMAQGFWQSTDVMLMNTENNLDFAASRLRVSPIISYENPL